MTEIVQKLRNWWVTLAEVASTISSLYRTFQFPFSSAGQFPVLPFKRIKTTVASGDAFTTQFPPSLAEATMTRSG